MKIPRLLLPTCIPADNERVYYLVDADNTTLVIRVIVNFDGVYMDSDKTTNKLVLRVYTPIYCIYGYNKKRSYEKS